MKTWILVAETSRAKLFETLNRGTDLKIIKEFDRPDARKKSQELTTDKPGRSFDSVGGGRHAEDNGNAPLHEQQLFAHELILFLDKSRANNKFSDLIIVAAPAFLGELRQIIPKALKSHITKEVGKDFATWMGKKDLKDRLASLFL